jgi:sec-independent protein translocase protein TatA
MFEPSIPHLLILLVILLLIFGAKRIPEIGKGLGGGLKEFKDSATGKSTDEPAPPPPAAAIPPPQPTQSQPAEQGPVHRSGE